MFSKTWHYRKFVTGVLDKGEFDNTLTKGQYNKALEQGKVVKPTPTGFELTDLPYSQAVLNKGGFTLVELQVGDTKVVGKHNFNNHPFNRKLGRVIAGGKAKSKLN